MKKSTFFVALASLIVIIIIASVAYKQLSTKVDTPSPLQEPSTSSKASSESAAKPKPDVSSKEESPAESEAEEHLALDFEMHNSDGEVVNFNDFLGTPIIVNFWASWCGPCIAEMPYFENAYNTYSEDELTILMVNLTDQRETKELASQFINENGFTFPVYYDFDQQASSGYAITSIPFTLFIGSDGNIVTYARGSLREEDLQKGITYLFDNEENLKNNS